jgi:phospholipid/cholesterol/gamma-HCH transport system substrate-binding protein
MKQARLELLVGVFVVLGIAAVAYLTVMLGSGSLLGGDTYEIEARFTNAGGLNPGSSVVVAGVSVGRVEAIRVNAEDYTAIATMRVMSGLKLPTDSMASIKTTGLIGDKYILLAPGADETSLKAGDRITMTESSVDIESLIGKMAFGSVDKENSPAPAPCSMISRILLTTLITCSFATGLAASPEEAQQRLKSAVNEVLGVADRVANRATMAESLRPTLQKHVSFETMTASRRRPWLENSSRRPSRSRPPSFSPRSSSAATAASSRQASIRSSITRKRSLLLPAVSMCPPAWCTRAATTA